MSSSPEETTDENPYQPPTVQPSSEDNPKTRSNKLSSLPNPLVPAFIGLFTYGSSSPYALVICLEQYFRPPNTGVPWRTHIALPLSALGCLVWAALSIGVGKETYQFLLHSRPSMYASLGFCIWLANIFFFGWTWWRITLLRSEK